MKRIELLVLLIAAASLLGCAENKYHTQPGVHHYTGCHEMGIDVKRNVMLIECPLEKK